MIIKIINKIFADFLFSFYIYLQFKKKEKYFEIKESSAIKKLSESCDIKITGMLNRP